MRKLPPFLRPAFLKLAENYIPAKKIIAWSGAFSRRQGCWQGVLAVGKNSGWSRALGRLMRFQNDSGFSR
jgi:hypothetical protein